MTETTKVDESVKKGASSPPANGVSAQAQKSIDEAAVWQEELSKVKAELRGLQGRQDKASDKLSKQQEAIERYEKLIADGKSPAEAKQTITDEDFRNGISQRLEALEGSLSVGTGTTVNEQSDTARIISNLELDANSAEVIEVLGKGLDGSDLELALTKLKLRQTNKPSPSAASAPSKTASHQSPDDSDDLLAEYAQLSINYTENIERIKKIEGILQERGVMTN